MLPLAITARLPRWAAMLDNGRYCSTKIADCLVFSLGLELRLDAARTAARFDCSGDQQACLLRGCIMGLGCLATKKPDSGGSSRPGFFRHGLVS